MKRIRVKAFKNKKRELRAFEDLINEIEVNGERFVPIERIAALAFNYPEKTVRIKAFSGVNSGYDRMAKIVFETRILSPQRNVCLLTISRNFNIAIYMEVAEQGEKAVFGSKSIGMPAANQLEIFRKLKEWRFINKI